MQIYFRGMQIADLDYSLIGSDGQRYYKRLRDLPNKRASEIQVEDSDGFLSIKYLKGKDLLVEQRWNLKTSVAQVRVHFSEQEARESV